MERTAVTLVQKPLLDLTFCINFGRVNLKFIKEKSGIFENWCLWQPWLYSSGLEVCFLLLYRHWFQMKWQLEPIMHNLHIRDQGAGMLNNQHYLLLHQVLVLTFHSSSAAVHSWMGIQPLTVHGCGRCYFAECFNSWDICSVMYSHKIIVSVVKWV